MLEGAEAVLTVQEFAGFCCLKKLRVSKKYRPVSLDEKLRFERTRREARLLVKAKEAGVLCPHVFAVSKDFILIEKLLGRTLNKVEKAGKKSYFEAGALLAKLHSLNIAHGDYTPANLMLVGKKLYVIDFGLGFVSSEDEDKAVDLLTFVNAVGDKQAAEFLRGYLKFGERKIIRDGGPNRPNVFKRMFRRFK